MTSKTHRYKILWSICRRTTSKNHSQPIKRFLCFQCLSRKRERRVALPLSHTRDTLPFPMTIRVVFAWLRMTPGFILPTAAEPDKEQGDDDCNENAENDHNASSSLLSVPTRLLSIHSTRFVCFLRRPRSLVCQGIETISVAACSLISLPASRFTREDH